MSVVIGLLAFLAAGCFGGSSNGGSSDQGRVSQGVEQASTSVLISGGIGQPAGSRKGADDQAHAICPSDATCQVVKLRGVSPTHWSAIAERHLTCSPAGGDYRDPQAACRALADFLKPRAPHAVCLCPLFMRPDYTIVGRYQYQPLHHRFDSCSLCGAPQQMQDDFNVLFNP